MSLTQQEALRKDKIEDKISPKGEKNGWRITPFRRREKSTPPFAAFFYDRRELFCPRILSFRSGSRWVRAHFLGKPQRLV
jgi:hypothetical protein